jgi:serine/threonine-protein kinase
MGGDGGAHARLPSASEIVGGKYRVRRVLGQGGMGVVFEAEHMRLAQPVALKFLDPQLVGLADIVTRFEREARRLRH